MLGWSLDPARPLGLSTQHPASPQDTDCLAGLMSTWVRPPGAPRVTLAVPGAHPGSDIELVPGG